MNHSSICISLLLVLVTSITPYTLHAGKESVPASQARSQLAQKSSNRSGLRIRRIIKAILRGDTENVLRRIDSLSEQDGSALHSFRDSDGNSVMHYAVQSQSDRLVFTLLNIGFQGTERNHAGITPAMRAVDLNDAGVLRVLLQCAQPDDATILIHRAAMSASGETIRLLVAAGARMTRNEHNQTPLEVAIVNSNPVAVEALLEHDAFSWRRISSRFPHLLLLSLLHSNHETFMLLTSRVPVDQWDSILSRYMSTEQISGTLLEIAIAHIEHVSYHTVVQLIQLGSPTMTRDMYGHTPLMNAILRGASLAIIIQLWPMLIRSTAYEHELITCVRIAERQDIIDHFDLPIELQSTDDTSSSETYDADNESSSESDDTNSSLDESEADAGDDEASNTESGEYLTARANDLLARSAANFGIIYLAHHSKHK